MSAQPKTMLGRFFVFGEKRNMFAGAALAALCTVVTVANALAGQDWEIITQKDELSGQNVIAVSIDSVLKIPDETGTKLLQPSLLIRCKDGETTLLVNWWRFISTGESLGEGILGQYKTHHVDYRIDNEPVVSDSVWVMSSDFRATAAFPGFSVDIILKLITAHQLVAQTLPYGSNPVQAKFNVEGLDKVIRKIAIACNWSKRLPTGVP